LKKMGLNALKLAQKRANWSDNFNILLSAYEKAGKK